MAKDKKKQNSTQQHVPVSAIYDGVIVSDAGNFSQVIMVNSVNFGLKSEDEQNAIIQQYQGFLNSLSFPIQIVMHSKQLDLTSYIKDLRERIPQESNELIRYQTQEYAAFVEKLISIANIMDKKFFIIVSNPLPPSEMSGKGFFSSLFGPKRVHLKVPLAKFTRIKEDLQGKVSNVISGLSSMGISADVLNTKQIIELYYRTYNPEEAMREKLKGDIGNIGVAKEEEINAQSSQAQPQQGSQAAQPQPPTQTPQTGQQTQGVNVPINKQ